MADPRQLPLFSSQPQSEDDLNRYTQIRHALPLFREYLKKEGKTENTINAFMGDLNLFIEYQGGEMSVSRFQTRHLNEFLHWMENERGVSCSRKTYARRVTSLKVFFKWLTTIEAVRHDPAEKVLQRSGEAPLSYALNPDEIERMAEFAATMERHGKPDTRPAMLFHLLLDTGIKKSEAKRLTVEDVHREDVHKPFLHVHHTSRNVYKERKIHLSPEWFPLYDDYCQQYEIEDAIFTCTPRNLEYIWRTCPRAPEFPPKSRSRLCAGHPPSVTSATAWTTSSSGRS